jgi:hypothetical protein
MSIKHPWLLQYVPEFVVCSFSSFRLVIVDFPDKNKFLTSEETALIKERVERDSSDAAHDPLTLKNALEYACDLKLWSERRSHCSLFANSHHHPSGFGTAYLCAAT